MNFQKFSYTLLICLLFVMVSRGQSSFQLWDNRVYKKIAVADTLYLDTCAIDQLNISGIGVDDYELASLEAKIWWKKKPKLDSVSVHYRRLPLDFKRLYSHKNRSLVDSNYQFSSSEYSAGNKKNADFISYDQLERSGSYGRNFSFGNNQDLVSNANFNLQLNGYLLDSIKVEAAITDNTVPFQPEGNTANLQEFDLISIRLSKNKRSLQLGDYNLNRPNAYFLNFTKRVQGLFFESDDKIGKKLHNRMGLSASMAKGEFARNIFMGSEGNQGPYRLVGNNGEQLFVVLAATEKVYVDNILQERGENADYIINYNTNEIRFMPRRPINQFSRIQVEFEYRTNNYLNSLIFAYNELSIGRNFTLRTNLYSNQDAKNQPFQQNLSAAQKQLLAGIGDSIQYALMPNINADTFAANKILYQLADTVWAGQTIDSIFVYSTDPTATLYSVSFSNVGAGNGDYALSGQNANGRVYQWVGKRMGSFSAVSLIITPKAHQVLTMAGTYQIDSFKKLNIEWAGSNKDPNTFSGIHNQNHQGMATKVTYDEKRFLGKRDTLNKSLWELNNSIHYEYVDAKFRAIAPYRAVEFGRDWNVPLSGISPEEHWAGWTGQLTHRKWGKAYYSINQYTRGADYKGVKNGMGYHFNNGRLNSGTDLSLMQANDPMARTRFFKPNVFLDYTFHKKIKSTIGASYSAEHNEARSAQSDSLHKSAFYFDISTAFLRSTAGNKINYNAVYFRRRDWLPNRSDFQLQTYSDNYSLQLGMVDMGKHRLNFTGAYRQLFVEDNNILGAKPESSLLGRLQYDGSVLKDVLSFSTLYEFGTGQEQKRNFTYIQVPAGQGVYNWIDYNNDGVQQLNEFVVGLYPDQKLFIRIFTPSDQYAKVNNVNFNQTIGFEPGNFFAQKRKSVAAKIARLISNQMALQVTHKILQTEGLKTFNPLYTSFSDTAVLLTNSSLNNSFFINRSSAKWGIDYNYLRNQGAQLLSFGLNENSNSQHLTRTRIALNKALTAQLLQSWSNRENSSGTSDGNTYNIFIRSTEPALIWMYKSAIRVSSSAKIEERANLIGTEQAALRSIILDARYSRNNSGIIQMRFTYSHITYNASLSTPIAFAMLDALKQGNNFLWYLNWQRRLGKGLELLIEYEGRKAGTDRAINTGRMSLRAIL